MKPTQRRQKGKTAFDLIEEATHALRIAPAGTLAAYFLGAIPFVLGLLFFWADMSRSPLAPQHLAGASLGIALLFFWMKFWQTIYARRIRAQAAGEPFSPLPPRACARIVLSQVILQPVALFILPLALIPVLPFPWVYAFFQNATALDHGGEAGLRELIKKSKQEAGRWPMQNHVVLAVMTAFGVCVFLNWLTICLLLPHLFKMLFGIQSEFIKSPLALLNTTFLAAMLGLTYLSVDPILKTIYALRCFYGESLQSGEDLKAELKPFVNPLPKAAAAIAILLCLFAATPALGASWHCPWWQWSRCDHSAAQRSVGAAEAFVNLIRDTGAWWQLSRCENSGGQRSAGPPEFFVCLRLATRHVPADAGRQRSLRTATSATLSTSESTPPGGLLEDNAKMQPPAPVESTNAAAARAIGRSISPPALDQAINQTIHESKYVWRMPREQVVEPETKQGVIATFIQEVGTTLRKWAKATIDWLRELWRKLFPRHEPSHSESGSGYGWIMWLQVLLYGLAAAAIAALLIFLYRVWRGWHRPPPAIAGEAIQPVPDVADENVHADQLPEDGWTKLARELLERGEYRLAMRAFYLAALAHLAARNLISIARFKSNRDYERELRRRGHSFPGLLAVFGDNVSLFERIWYGMHDASRETVDQFAASLERLKGGA